MIKAPAVDAVATNTFLSIIDNRSGSRRDVSVLKDDAPIDVGMAVFRAFDWAYADPAPIPMLLWCPECGVRHIDEGDFATRVHHSHACQTCGLVWRPALVPTVGVQFLPGFKNSERAT